MPDTRTVKGCCPLDCHDACSWVAHVADGRVMVTAAADGPASETLVNTAQSLAMDARLR